jgi:uncharacterized membrane protein YphA (DoxX/SURF4 family)/thiol-disulfide isomerase/thioredoxin
MNWGYFLFRAIAGVVFILSGFFKLYPVELFELSLIDTQIISWDIAPMVARIFIGGEILLGVFLILPFQKTKFSVSWAIILTLFFTLYLVLFWWIKGNEVNCGCMGELIKMTPAQSLLKNAGLMICLLLSRKLEGIVLHFNFRWLFYPILLISLILPFILNPISLSNSKPGSEHFPYPLQTELFPTHVNQNLNFDPNSDIALLGFMSTTCDHCRIAARKLNLANNKFNLPPIHLLMIGPLEEMDNFKLESESNFEYTFYGEESFFKFNNGILPTLLYIKNGEVHNKWQGDGVDLEAFRWIDQQMKNQEIINKD